MIAPDDFFGPVARNARLALGLSQDDFAEIAGVGQTIVSRVERAPTATSAAKYETRAKLAAAAATQSAARAEASVVCVDSSGVERVIGEAFDAKRHAITDAAMAMRVLADAGVGAVSPTGASMILDAAARIRGRGHVLTPTTLALEIVRATAVAG